jgi:hypothetical protein
MTTMIPRIGQSPSFKIEPTRPRETPRQGAGWSEVWRQGAKVLLAGAEVAGGLVGGPVLSAAVARMRTGADSTGAMAAAGSAGSATSANGQSFTNSVRAMQAERMNEELQLIALQSEVQRQDRQVSLTSNLLKARHDTAKQAISNIRS